MSESWPVGPRFETGYLEGYSLEGKWGCVGYVLDRAFCHRVVRRFGASEGVGGKVSWAPARERARARTEQALCELEREFSSPTAGGPG